MLAKNFVAIDFETANGKRGSACAVGLAKYENGELTETFHSIIRPHESVLHFQRINMLIHKIPENEILQAPEWGQIFPKVREFIGNSTLIAHNMPFDDSVLKALATIYRFPEITNRKICTLDLSRSIHDEEIKNHKLKTVYKYYFPGEKFQHHQAEADAVAAGKLFIEMLAVQTGERPLPLPPTVKTKRAPKTTVKPKETAPQIQEVATPAPLPPIYTPPTIPRIDTEAAEPQILTPVIPPLQKRADIKPKNNTHNQPKKNGFLKSLLKWLQKK